jgi:hypothetical protein
VHVLCCLHRGDEGHLPELRRRAGAAAQAQSSAHESVTDAPEREAARYRAAWSNFRIRRAVSWGLFLLYLPAGMVLWRLFPPGSRSIDPVVIWFIAIGLSSVHEQVPQLWNEDR